MKEEVRILTVDHSDKLKLVEEVWINSKLAAELFCIEDIWKVRMYMPNADKIEISWEVFTRIFHSFEDFMY